FGPETDRLVAEALERDSWSAEKWRAWQQERLAFLLHRAATRVPYYRAHWQRRRQRGDRASFEQLEHWPVLRKDELRRDPRAFVADDCDLRAMFHERTSGTSGKPLDLWWTRPTVREWSALVEARVRQWHGVSRHDPWAILGGQPVVPGSAKRPPFWVHNRGLRQLYLSANHVSARHAPDYIAAIERHRATHLWAYSSSVAYVATEALRAGCHPHGLKAVFSNAEPLLPWQRDAVRRGLGCEARETYGMAEIAVAGSECPHGGLHLWPEVGWAEVWADETDEPVADGASGRFICTSLLNADMPLVRYELGDRGRMRPSGWRCACGRALPGIAEVEGRTNDMLITSSGRRVFWLNPVLYGLPIEEAQIVQSAIGSLTVRYVPAPEFGPATRETIRERLHSRLGEGTVTFEQVDRIPREANGKFRAVKCTIPPESLP
ncbi:MAG: hypothetical protein RIR76_515, partial [Verrucomicrobiota bacterium]